VQDYLFPEWDVWTSFANEYANNALQSDSLENSHPIEVEVASSSQVNEIFDAISYSKGASVIRMIAEYVGEQAMRKGLNGECFVWM
jgi:aminopeptidase N